MMLSPIQQEIIDTPGNLIIQASAGTGKTHTLVSKIAAELESKNTFQSIAAITFTIKAAKEIQERLTTDTRNHFIGTNHSFAIEEIIKPFFKDVYGLKYDLDLNTDYSATFFSFNEGLKKIKESQILGGYKDTKKNFVFDLALEIVKKSKACRLYLKAKYFKIFIDEYQDCDLSMHEFFMFLCDELHIETFVVGDEKQAIYTWRGAKPSLFSSITNKANFKTITMLDNFRSCQQIQNYSNLLFDKTRHLYKPLKSNNNIIWIKTTDGRWIEKIRQYVTDSTKTALLRRTNNEAESDSLNLKKANLLFTFIPHLPISDITTNSSWLYMSIARYILLKKYSIYDFIEEIPNSTTLDNKAFSTLELKLNKIKSSQTSNEFKFSVINLFQFLNCEFQVEHIDNLYKTVTDDKYHVAFEMDKYQQITLTIHSAKGLEFDQVILFAEDFNLSIDEGKYIHYVSVTRAKSRVIIIRRNNLKAIQFKSELEKIFKKSNLSIQDLVKPQ